MNPILAVILMLVAGCTAAGVPLDTSFSIALGEERTVGPLRIRFVEVNDSRCAPNVTCVWEGDGAVTLDVDGERVVVHTHGSAAMPRSAVVRGHEITLEDLQPVAAPSKTDYRARLRVR